MWVLLQSFLAGGTFFLGLVTVAIAAFGSDRWARAAVLTGFALTALSAVPVAVPAYIALGIAVAGWVLVVERSPRRGWAVRVVVVVAATALALVELPFHIRRTQRLEGEIPIVILGDSLSAGRDAWPAAFSASSGCRVVNRAYPGARLADGVRQLERPIPPCEVLIALGGNDILGDGTADRFRADLEAVLQAVTANGCHGTMLELPLFPLQNRYGRAQRRLAARYGIVLVPRRVLATALTRPGHTTDGLHLSSHGHLWLGQELGGWMRCG